MLIGCVLYMLVATLHTVKVFQLVAVAIAVVQKLPSVNKLVHYPLEININLWYLRYLNKQNVYFYYYSLNCNSFVFNLYEHLAIWRLQENTFFFHALFITQNV